MLRQIYF